MKFCSKRGFKNLLVASTLFVLHDRLPEPTISVITLHKLAIVLRLNFAYLITEGPLVYSYMSMVPALWRLGTGGRWVYSCGLRLGFCRLSGWG